MSELLLHLISILFLICFPSLFLFFNLRSLVYQVAWSADSNYLVSCSKDSTIKLWSVKNTKKALHTLPGHEDEVRTLISYWLIPVVFTICLISYSSLFIIANHYFSFVIFNLHFLFFIFYTYFLFFIFPFLIFLFLIF